MPCRAFENRLLDYAGLADAQLLAVDAHLAQCPDCRDYLETLAAMDRELTALLGASSPAPDFPARVLARANASASLARPTAVPELLDCLGWTAVASILCLLAWWLAGPVVPLVSISRYAWYGTAAAAMFTALWIGLRSYADLRE